MAILGPPYTKVHCTIDNTQTQCIINTTECFVLSCIAAQKSQSTSTLHCHQGVGEVGNAQHLSPSCFSPASAHLATTSHLDICLIAQPFSLSPELKAGCFLQRVILNSMEMSRVRCWEEPFHIFWHPFLQGSTWWQ